MPGAPIPDVTGVAPDASLYQLLAGRAARSPDAVALCAPGRAPLTYVELLAQVDDVVATLEAAGVRRGDRVALALPNGPDGAVAFLAVAASTACSPLNRAYRAAEYDTYLPALRATTLIVPAGDDGPVVAVARKRGLRLLELSSQPGAVAGVFTLSERGPGLMKSRRAPLGARALGWGRAPAGMDERAGPDDVAVVMLTSGTTARPKIVPLTHRNLRASASYTGAALALTPHDRCLNLAPLVHIHGLCMVLASLAAGASVICPPDADPLRFFAWLDECAATWYVAGPAVHQAILAQATAHRAVIARRPLRAIRSGSASLPAHVLYGLERTFGAPVIEAYGMTETAPLIACNPLPPRERKIGSAGPAAGPELAIMDAAGALLPAGTEGEVVVRGPNVMAGYENDEAANRAAFVDGWFRTGDQGYLDKDGYLFLTGRLKEMINRGGQKIAPREVDEALLAHPAVAQAVAFAAPHPTLGEEVAAAVVLRAGASVTAHELRAFVATRLAGIKVPRQVVIRDALPGGATGKPWRAGLAEELGLAAPHGAAQLGLTMPRDAARVLATDDLERRMIALWERVLGVRPVGRDDDFFDLGGNSLLAATLFAQIAGEFGWRLPLGTLRDGATVAYLSEMLRRQEHGPVQSPLVLMQPRGARPPLFCLHAGDGSIAHYRRLIRYLGRDRPVYGLRLPAMPSQQGSEVCVEEMAARYLHAIQTVQPEGPYYLAGYSGGGLIAYELARQLRAQGQAVAFLALIDTVCPGSLSPARQLWNAPAGPIWRLRFHTAVWTVLPPRYKVAYASARIRSLARRVAGLPRTLRRIVQSRRTPPPPPDEHAPAPLPSAGAPAPSLLGADALALGDANLRVAGHVPAPPLLAADALAPLLPGADAPARMPPAVESAPRLTWRPYTPRPYPGPITYFRGRLTYTRDLGSADPRSGWRGLAAGGLEMHDLPGNHATLVYDPVVVRLLAEQMRICLAGAQ